MKMKSAFIISLIFITFGCQSSAPKQEAATTATATPVVTQKDSVVETKSTIPCSMTGKLVEKFEQNNAVFERLANEEKELEWLKITTKDGKCFTIDSLNKENHHTISFEDWDKDGMKDRIDNWKWDYSVSLFDKTSNQFSRHIAGRFCGDQWDFDAKQNLKYQFLENKFGGIYELYKLVGANKTILSQVAYITDYDENSHDKIEIRKNIVETEEGVKFDTLKMDNQLFTAMKPKENEDDNVHQAKVKKSLEAYWRKNLPVFMK